MFITGPPRQQGRIYCRRGGLMSPRTRGAAAVSPRHTPIALDRFDAVLFDLDGVLTPTAKIHSNCWKTMFDDFLRRRAAERKEPFQPFDIDADYKRYVDGKLRYEGVRSFLASRNIALAQGTPDDHPTSDTICGLGNRKDEMVKTAIDEGEVEPYPGSVALVRQSERHPPPLRASALAAVPALEPVPTAPGVGPGRQHRHSGQGIDEPDVRRALLLGHGDICVAVLDLHVPAAGPQRSAVSLRHPG
jgi:hypothetical protein